MNEFRELAFVWESEFGSVPFSLDERESLTEFFAARHSEDSVVKYVTAVYEIYGGMPDDVYDRREFSFWSCNKSIVFSNRAPRDSGVLCFADYLAEAAVYGVVLSGEMAGSVWMIHNYRLLEKVALSLDDFFSLRLSHPEEIGIFL